MYAFPDAESTVDPLSYFRTPFRQPKYENSYADFFKDVAHPSLRKQHVTVYPKELHFGYAKTAKTLSFDVRNNSSGRLRVNWIHGIINAAEISKTNSIILNVHRSATVESGDGNGSFAIDPVWCDICSCQSTTFRCTFRPKTVSNVYFAEFEAIVSFDPDQFGPQRSDHYHPTAADVLPKCVAPMNVSLTATGTANASSDVAYIIFVAFLRQPTYGTRCTHRYSLVSIV